MQTVLFDGYIHSATEREALTFVMSETAIRRFVETYFSRRREFLALAEGKRLPFYLLDRPALLERIELFCDAFRREIKGARFFYAVKSNNHPEVARTILSAGMGLDVSGQIELEMALSLGAEKILFTGPGKSNAELELAVDHADRMTILMDSFGELRRLEAIAARKGVRIRAGVRLTTDPSGLWRKFGVPMDRLGEFLDEAASFEHVRCEGLQCHSSWNLNPWTQVALIRKIGESLRKLSADQRARIAFIDLGGGFWPPEGEWLQRPDSALASTAPEEPAFSPLTHYWKPAAPIRLFAEAIGKAIDEHLSPIVSSKFFFEPGRWLSHHAMCLMLQVIDKKEDDLVITDGGTNMIGWERFETDYFPILNLTRPASVETPCHILGSLCTPHDVWGYAYWGQDIQPGDILLIPAQGAYTYSLRQEFIKPLPDVVTISGDEESA